MVGIIDASGNRVATYSYDAWGNTLSASGTMAEVNPIRYRGYYYDSEIGMYYLQSRYYDQSTGRFLNADDAGLVELLTESSLLGANIFAYCENNGVNDYDLFGHISLPSALNKIWKIILAILPYVDILGIGLSVATYLIPGLGKIKFICNAVCVAVYIFTVINCICTLTKKNLTKAKKYLTIFDLVVNATKAVLTIVSNKARKLANKLLKKKAYLITVLKAVDGVLGNALSLSRDMVSIANYCMKKV